MSDNERETVIALVGNPNVGKSTVFNALTHMRQHTGNWPGKTVSTARGGYTYAGRDYTLVDLPGTYSLRPASAEEEVTADYLRSGEADVTLVVADATTLERNLALALQVMETAWPVVVCVNLLDEAAKKHIQVDLTALQDLLGVPISHYAGVDMVGLKAAVDAMGGVDYDVDVRIELNGRVLEKGYQHLDGQQVLDYCRARKGISTDVGRADRQQRMLFAILEQLQSRDQLKNFPKIYLSVQDKVYTDLNVEQIAALTLFAMDLDLDTDLHRHTLEGEYINNTPYSGASYYVLDTEALQELIKEIFGVTIQTDYRFDYHYVLADKAAATGLTYADCAEYLTNQVIYNTYAAQQYGVDQAALALRTLCTREFPQDWSEEQIEEAMQVPLDQEAIEAATQDLANRIYAMCTAYGVTQARVDPELVPEPIYALLPPM